MARLLDVAAGLGEKRGPFLFQLPPYLKKDAARLRDFLHLLPRGARAAFEFRDPSWDDDEVSETLRAAGAALCLADTDERAAPTRGSSPTADWGYLRLRRADYDEAALAGLGRAHPRPAVGRGLRLLQARGRGARAGAGARLAEIASGLTARLRIDSTMAWPWKRPFSMKIRPVSRPDTTAPAT